MGIDIFSIRVNIIKIMSCGMMIMKKHKVYFEFIILILFWLLLVGKVNTISILSGSIVSLFAVFFSGFVFGKIDIKRVRYINIFVLMSFMFNVFLEIIIAAYYHIIRVVVGYEMTVIFDIKLDIFDEMAIILISNAITLTPGTMTVQVNGNTITIAAFIKDEKDISSISDRILEKFQTPFIKGGLR